MGVASSKNTAEAVASVMNYVSQSTSANSAQVNQLSQNVNFVDCDVNLTGDLNVTERADLAVSNSQIIQAKQDANLKNNIQQQMLQQAVSTVGFLGIGYADAQNDASEFVNSTSTIIQDMNTSATQYNGTNQGFTCDRSHIDAKNININFSSSADFLSSQTLNQQQTAKIVNNISQSVSQKASATIQGISGLILIILLIIAIIVWAVMKPLSSGSGKIVIGLGASFLMAGLLVWMYLAKAPPFFSEPNTCINNSQMGIGSDPTINCINQKPQTLALGQPPLKYIYGITDTDNSVPKGNLVQIAIASVNSSIVGNTSGPNGGYRVDVLDALENSINSYAPYASALGVPNIPNPLTLYVSPSHPLPAGTYYQIPEEYIQNSSTGDTEAGKCTPATLSLAYNSSGSITSCSLTVDPDIQGLSITTAPALGLANLNRGDWSDYFSGSGKYPFSGPNDTVDNRAFFARFVLCDIIGDFDLHIFIKDNELIKYIDENNNVVIGMAKDHPNNTYRYHPYNPPKSWSSGISGGGSITGQVGVWNSRTYKFQNFMSNIGKWILMALFGVAFLYMFWTWYKNRKNNQQKKD